MHRDYAEGVSFMQIHRAELGFADAAGALQHRLEHRLQLAWRTTDHLENLGRRGLLLQRFAQIVGPLAQLFQQAGVIDRDDRLIGEILDQLDLLVGEPADLLAKEVEGADQLALLQHWNAEQGPETSRFAIWSRS